MFPVERELKKVLLASYHEAHWFSLCPLSAGGRSVRFSGLYPTPAFAVLLKLYSTLISSARPWCLSSFGERMPDRHRRTITIKQHVGFCQKLRCFCKIPLT